VPLICQNIWLAALPQANREYLVTASPCAARYRTVFGVGYHPVAFLEGRKESVTELRRHPLNNPIFSTPPFGEEGLASRLRGRTFTSYSRTIREPAAISSNIQLFKSTPVLIRAILLALPLNVKPKITNRGTNYANWT
jgi:hypothetical protein